MTAYLLKRGRGSRRRAAILLAKYVEHVRQCEGIDFIDRIGEVAWGSDVEFTPEEIAHLETLRRD